MKNLTLIALGVFLFGHGSSMADSASVVANNASPIGDNATIPKICKLDSECPQGTSCVQSLESKEISFCLKPCKTVANCPTAIPGHHECTGGYCHLLRNGNAK